MHIKLEELDLKSLSFEVRDAIEDFEQPVKFDASCRTVFLDEFRFAQNIKFVITDEIESPTFKLIFEFEIKFYVEISGKPTLKEFAYANGPAYIIAYARELITNITSRSIKIPTVYLQPVNVFELIKEGLHQDMEVFLSEKESDKEVATSESGSTEQATCKDNNS